MARTDFITVVLVKSFRHLSQYRRLSSVLNDLQKRAGYKMSRY